VHGPEHEAIRRRYIEARYKLFPYLYTQVEETSRTGIPLMRPYWLEHPDAEGTYENDRIFFFGPDLLVEPKIDETLDPMALVVPAGTWFDYWTGERLTGPQYKMIEPALGDLPVLVRGGSIVPHQPLVQSTSEVPRGPLELRVYPGPDCRGSLYLDDGTSFEYRKGAFLRLAFTCTETPDAVAVRMSPADGSYVPWFDTLRVVVWADRGRTKSVTVPYDKSGFDVTVAQ
jgi:alpha-glucosidase